MPPRRQRALTLTDHLRGMGLTSAQISRVPPRHRRALVHHMMGGNRFTDFFTKTLKHGFEDAGNKIKDAFTKPVNLPSGVEKVLNGLRDYVNPVIAKTFPAIIEKIPIPGASVISNVFDKAAQGYLKLMPPESGPFKGGRRAGARRAGARRAGMVGHKPTKGMYNIMGAGRHAGALRHCSVCGSAGATAATCPLNPMAAHRRHSKHPMAKMM